MRFNEILKEANSPVSASQDYQRLMSFVKANRLEGIPPEQQIAVALFKELQKQQQQNKNISAELAAAEERIELGDKRDQMYGTELSKHRAELDREKQAVTKQQTAVGQLDKQQAERAQASEKQIQALTSRLETIKAKPGMDQGAAAALEQQIKKLERKGISADKYAQLEKSIADIQSLQQVDDNVIKGLVNQVKDAQRTSQEFEKTRQSIGDVNAGFDEYKQEFQTLRAEAEQAAARAEQLSQELRKYKDAMLTVSQLEPAITQVIMPKIQAMEPKIELLDKENDSAWEELKKLDSSVYQLSTAMSARQQATKGMMPRTVESRQRKRGKL